MTWRMRFTGGFTPDRIWYEPRVNLLTPKI